MQKHKNIKLAAKSTVACNNYPRVSVYRCTTPTTCYTAQHSSYDLPSHPTDNQHS